VPEQPTPPSQTWFRAATSGSTSRPPLSRRHFLGRAGRRRLRAGGRYSVLAACGTTSTGSELEFIGNAFR
jgi:hypothetical protein